MKLVDRNILLKSLRQLVRGLVNFCLKHSITSPEIEACIRQAFVEAARDSLNKNNQIPSTSRLSVITGLNRRQVQQLQQTNTITHDNASFLMKVLGQWQNDKRFSDDQGQAMVLSCGFEKSEFNRLVGSISKELNPATVLFELERVGAIKRETQEIDGKKVDCAKLLLEVYQPAGDLEAGFRVAANDIQDFIETVEENLVIEPNISNLHLRTEYDRIRPTAVVELKRWLLQEGYAFHERARDKFAEFDQDVNPDPSFTGKCVRIVLGSFGKVFKQATNHDVVEGDKNER
jgi:Family of unknown function (DUF6502)